MGDIRNFKGIRRAVLNFDYYWVLGKFLCYKVLQVGGGDYFPFYPYHQVQGVLQRDLVLPGM